MNAEDYLLENPQRPSAEDFLHAETPSAESFLQEGGADWSTPARSSEELGARNFQARQALGMGPEGSAKPAPAVERALAWLDAPLADTPSRGGPAMTRASWLPGATGNPIQQLAESDTAAGGAYRAVEKTIQGLTTPKNIAAMGVAGAGSIPARVVAGYFGAEMAQAMPQLAAEAGRVSVEGSPGQKGEAYTALGLNTLMTIGALHGATRLPQEKAPEPNKTAPPAEQMPNKAPAMPESPAPMEAPLERPQQSAAKSASVEMPTAEAFLAERGASAPALEEPSKFRAARASVARSELERPWDILDEVEANLSGKIRLNSALELDPEFKPTGAAKRLFSTSEGRHGVDGARQAVELATGRTFQSDDAFMYAMQSAAEARRSWREQFYANEKRVAAEAKKLEMFAKDTRKAGEGRQSIHAEILNAGDTFTVRGQRVRVKELEFDDNGEVVGAQLDGGNTYGEPRVSREQILQIDNGTHRKAETKIEFVPDFVPDLAAEEVPLGIHRPAKMDPALRALPEEHFDGVYRDVRKQIHEAEGRVDEMTRDMTRAEREQLGEIQDRWEAVTLERYRRNVTDLHPDELMRDLLEESERAARLGGETSNFYKARILLEELQRQGVTEQQAMQSISLRSPDAVEIFRGKMQDLRSVLERVPAEPLPKARRLEDRLDALKIDTRGQLHAFGLLPEAWNTLIDLVKVGIKGGRSVAQAVEWALRGIRSRFPNEKFDQDGARKFLVETFGHPTRQLGEKVLGSREIDPEVQAQVKRYNYDPLPNETSRQTADRIIQEQGIEEAMAMWRNERNQMGGATRTALGQAIVKRTSFEVLSAKAQGGERYEQAIAQQARFLDEHMTRSTDVAQALQAFRIYSLATPEGIVRSVRKLVLDSGSPRDWSPDLARDVQKKANETVHLPEGFQRDRAILDIFNRVQRAQGIKWTELPMAFWYANILSGPLTHLKNILGNVYNVGAYAGLQMLRRPSDTLAIIKGLGAGISRATPEALKVLQTGERASKANQKLEAARGVEALPNVFLPWKLVARALSAEDMLFYRGAEEMKSAVLARAIAKRTGARGPELQRKVDEILSRTPEKVAAAKEQATKEGLKGLDYKRRVKEIMEQARPEGLRESAAEYALRATFNQKPEGVIGTAARYFNAFAAEVPLAKLAVPFTNVIANVMNESLNYIPPVGGYRALRGHWSGQLHGRPVLEGEVFDTGAKAAVGTLALGALALLTAQSLTDDKAPVAVFGAGPTTPDQKKQLRETGWRPYTVRVKGHYVNFQQTPLMVPMALLGNYFDAIRFKKLEQRDALQRVAVATAMFGKVVSDQSWMDGLAGVFETMNREPSSGSADAMLKQGMRTGTSFVVPNALMQIDQLFDPTVYDASTMQAAFVNSIPFVRREGKPALNVMGEPVTNERMRNFLSDTKENELWKVLSENQAWVSVPRREDIIIGDKKRGEDFYRILDPDEFYDFVQQSGERIRFRLERELSRLELMRPERLKLRVQEIAEEERARVKARFRMR